VAVSDTHDTIMSEQQVDMFPIAAPAPTAMVPAAPTQAPASLLNFIAAAVTNPDVDVAKLEALLRMQREVASDDARTQFNRALHAAQMEMPRVSKRGTIKLGDRKGEIPFATWEDVDAALRPVMKRHGFSLSFTASSRSDGTGAIVTARLLHSAGHAEVATIPLPPDVGPGRNALQSVGSTLSYAKRYLAEMLFNIVREGADDDGEVGGAPRISAAQKERLVELMQDAAADTEAFLRTLQVPTLDDLPAAAFPIAENMLRTKIARQKRDANAGGG
jgi:hypothetical protein